MRALASAFGAGLLFGVGLWLAGAATPQTVLGFLDVAGAWNPALLFMMAGAVAVTFATSRLVLKRRTPWLAPRFVLPERGAIDGRLVGGAAIFGVGWGLVGYCPGPAITALSTLSPDPIVFVTAMVAGGLAHGIAFGRSDAAAQVKSWFESPKDEKESATPKRRLSKPRR